MVFVGLATAFTMFAARIEVGHVKVLLVWLAPIYLAMIFDFIKQRLILPVYIIGIGAMADALLHVMQ